MRIKLLSLLILVFCVIALNGCGESAEKDNVIFDRYYLTTLKISESSDIIPLIKGENELVSQSDNAVAAWGETKKGRVIWFNAVAFDDENSIAIRKYGFITNEKADRWFNRKGQTLRFDAEAVIDSEVLTAPYSNENAKNIAILKSLLKDFSKDLQPLKPDSQTLESAEMMVRQTLKTIINTLEESPALAANLETIEGMDYDHMNYDEAKIRMVIDNDIVKVKTMSGKTIKDFEEKPEIISM